MIHFFKKFLVGALFIFLLLTTVGALPLFAKGGLVPCDGVVEVQKTTEAGVPVYKLDNTGQPTTIPEMELKSDCDFETIFGKPGTTGGGQQGDDRGWIKKIFDMIILFILPVTAVWCVYVGFLYLTSGGNAETHSKAIKIGLNVLGGLVLVICAWLIVATIMRAFGVQDAFNLLKT